MNRGEDGIRRRRRNLQVLYLSGGQSCHLADGFDRQVQCLHPSGIRLLLIPYDLRQAPPGDLRQDLPWQASTAAVLNTSF